MRVGEVLDGRFELEARARLLEAAGRIDDPARRARFLRDVEENARTLELARAWLGLQPEGAPA